MDNAIIFSHNDLDGVGVVAVCLDWCKLHSIKHEYYMCGYNNIDSTVVQVLSAYDPAEGRVPRYILIGDISVSRDTARLLQSYYEAGTRIVLRDHHVSASWLNMYDWAAVYERDGYGTPRCGTYWMYNELYPGTVWKPFIDTVNAWDTWTWKQDNNIAARRLNALYSVLGASQFLEYMNRQVADARASRSTLRLFSDTAQAIVDTEQAITMKMARACEHSMYLADLTYREHTYTTGIVYANRAISDIAEYILSGHPEIDILMLVSMPSSISLRCTHDLEVPLAEIARALTGQGGGHPQSAGAVINPQQFKAGFSRLFRALGKEVSMDNLELKY